MFMFKKTYLKYVVPDSIEFTTSCPLEILLLDKETEQTLFSFSLVLREMQDFILLQATNKPISV